MKLNQNTNKMEQIKFSYNWNNKLDCLSFTTIRPKSNKYKVGQIYEILLKGNSKGKATIAEIKEFKLEKLNEFIARLDTGYNREKCIEIITTMYKNQDVSKMTFQLILCIKS
jgi:hypothetical protein